MRTLALLAALSVAAPALAQEPPPRRESTAFTLTSGTARTPEQLAVRFDTADLAIRILPQTQSIDAVATLTFTATAPTPRIVVELDTLLTISEIAVDGQTLSADAWANPDGRLTITLPSPLAAGTSTTVRIAYAGQPRTAPNAPWDGGFVWRQTPDGRPWIASAVQGEGCDLFWPCIDHPQGEPGRVDLHITVPSDLAAPSNGRLVGKTDNEDGTTTWNWTARDPNTYAIALNVGPYQEISGVYESRFGNLIPLHFWHLPNADPAKPQALFAEFAPMLDFYEATVGPYPFGDEKMGVVETPHLGMEHQTINAYGNGYKLDGRGYDWLLQHELAHEWFGNQLTNVSWDDMWLHEGLGTYMQPLYARWLTGERYMERELADMRETLSNRFPLVSGREQDAGTVYEDATGPGLDLYYKGALVAHTLRLMIGDEAFNRSLTRLVYGTPEPVPGRFRPRYATTADFIAIVEDEAGQDLDWFFDAYLYQAALPRLKEIHEDGRLLLEWETSSAFPMPVEVEIAGQRSVVTMTGGRGEVRVPPGSHVIVDPDNRVLRQLDFIDRFRAPRP